MSLQPLSVPNELLHVLDPSDVEHDVQVREQRLHHVPNAVLAHDAETPDPESADEDWVVVSIPNARGSMDNDHSPN